MLKNELKYHSVGSKFLLQRPVMKEKLSALRSIQMQCYTTTYLHQQTLVYPSALCSFYSVVNPCIHHEWRTQGPQINPFSPVILHLLFSSPVNSLSPKTNFLWLLLPWKCPKPEHIFFCALEGLCCGS